MGLVTVTISPRGLWLEFRRFLLYDEAASGDSMTNDLKVFTVEEANQLLPALIQLLTELKKKRDEASDLEVQIDALELIASSGTSSSVKELNHLLEEHQKIVGEFYSIVNEIHSYRCFLKDVDLGLIDFCGVIDGRMVYLCWRLGEERVSFWHEVEQGYSNRKPLAG